MFTIEKCCKQRLRVHFAMPSIQFDSVIPPQPATQRNFTTHLSYDEASNAIAYPCGKSAFVRFFDEDEIAIQFTGHGTASVTVVRFSPIKGSQYICSGDDSGKVIVWGYARDEKSKSIQTTIKSEFQVLAGPITDISWDFEGRRLCVVGEGRDKFGAFISWDSGNTLGEISGHSQRINACHFKQSRPMRAITVGDDGAVVFYQGPPFKFITSDRVHHDQGKFVRDVQFSPGNGEYAITVGYDRKIVCFDGKTGEFVKYVEDKKNGEEIGGGIFALSWIDGDRFVTASADGCIRVWAVKSSKIVQKWQFSGKSLENQQVGVVAIKNDQIVSLSLDGTLNFFRIGESSIVKTIKGHNKGITALTVSPLLSGSYDGRIMDWSTNPETMHNDHSNLIVAIDNSMPPKYASVSWDDTLKVSGIPKYEFKGQPKVSSSANDSGIMAAVTDKDVLMILDSYKGEILHEISLTEPASAVGITGDVVAVGLAQSYNIQVFRASDLSVSYTLSTPLRANASCISISPSKKYLAAGDVMGKILLYDLETKNVTTSRWAFHTSRINAISWRPSDTDVEDLVATASLDTNIFIYSVKRPMRTIKYLNAHKDGVTAVLWDTSASLVTAGSDSCIKKWSVDFE